MFRGIQKRAAFEGPSRKRSLLSSRLRDTKITASKDEPQYQIKSDKTDHIAMHKGSALTKLTKTKRSTR